MAWLPPGVFDICWILPPNAQDGQSGSEDRNEADRGLVEAGRLYHAPWTDSIRHTTVGGLLLGFDFVWSDLACYAVGVGLGVALETIISERLPAETA
jgi:hypothetical protein